MSNAVLFISHEASRTGAPIVLLNVLQWLHRNGTASFRVVTGVEGELSSEFAALGATDALEPAGLAYRALRRLGLNATWSRRHLSRVQRDLANESFRLVYVNSIASGGILDQLAIGDVPVICHVHELTDAIRALGLAHLAAIERRRPLYIAVSHIVKECLIRDFAIAGDRIEVVHGFAPNSVAVPPLSEDARDALRRELGLALGARFVCGCGSIELRKGTDLFLEVARRVLAAAGDERLHFVWVGGKPDKVRDAMAKVATAGLTGQVHFIGPRQDTARYFAAADVFLLTSREDPFPLVVMEAARAGAPTVCFRDGGGAPEFVESDAGFCVAQFDVDEMSRRALELLSASALRLRMGESAKRKVEQLHTVEHGASRIAMLMSEAMRRGRGATWTRQYPVKRTACDRM